MNWGEFCMAHKGQGGGGGQLFKFGEILGDSGGTGNPNVIGKCITGVSAGVSTGVNAGLNAEKRYSGCAGLGGPFGGCDGGPKESISQYFRTSQGSNEQANGRFFFG